MLKDYEIAKQNKMENIESIAKKMNLSKEEIEMYGDYKAKMKHPLTQKQKGKLILVTSINPTPYGEGKTTVAIGLYDALRSKNINAMLTLREPSLGPVFGVKGGATGGGYAQVVPMEEINLHFNGDFHAITSANNLICAMIDNTLYHGNTLNLNPDEIYFTRTIDLNDRALRNITINDSKYQRKEKFTITAACEIMSTVCMAKDMSDLRDRLNNLIIGKNKEEKYVFVRDLNITGSLLALLKNAIKPNIVQTIEKNPVLVHGGPFANITPGCNTVAALNHALAISDIVITEAGFGFDLGGFKFLDIVSRMNHFNVSGIVLVVTLKALKHHGKEKNTPLEQLKEGLKNLDAHMENLNLTEVPYIITLNKYSDDTEEEIETLKNYVDQKGISFVINNVFELGSKGAMDLAMEVLKLDGKKIHYFYNLTDSLEEKIEKVCKKLLHASTINYSEIAKKKLEDIDSHFKNLPICIAKTQYSISDQKDLLGNPRDYTVTIKDLRVYNGAGFITVYLGDIMTMPGLPIHPAAELIDVDNDTVVNIF
ncbi:TPA: formate--tetrahydrofolate ligase [Candidatus Ventrenecus avicola]|nr:formate--tetrahydrofolate ligase [Candidatus Ventrenecus avicola]